MVGTGWRKYYHHQGQISINVGDGVLDVPLKGTLPKEHSPFGIPFMFSGSNCGIKNLLAHMRIIFASKNGDT